MAITLISSDEAQSNNGGDPTITFGTAPAEDDYVVLIGGHGADASVGSFGPITSGYTAIATVTQTTSPNEHGVGCWYKKMGATPDTTVQGEGGGDNGDGVIYFAYVLRGADLTTFLDTAAITNQDNNDAYDPASITTVTDGAWVIAICAAHRGAGEPSSAPTGYSNFLGAEQADTDGFDLGAATKEVASAGAEDPGAFTGFSGSSEDETEFTVAIRPAGGGGPGADELMVARQFGGDQPELIETQVVAY